MREIKFRGRWRHRDGSAAEIIENINERPISDLNEDYFIIEQFTGLTDSKGVEIYEGDVVKGKYWNNGKDHRVIGKVIFEYSCWYVEGVNKYHLYKMLTEMSTMKIIGKIHENPELLNQGK